MHEKYYFGIANCLKYLLISPLYTRNISTPEAEYGSTLKKSPLSHWKQGNDFLVHRIFKKGN